jgi:hypothetical protein
LGAIVVLAVLLSAASCGGGSSLSPGEVGDGGPDVPTYVVWQETVATGYDSGYWRIHCLDLDNGEECELAGSDDVYVHGPAVSGQTVVWEDRRESDRVFARDLTSGKEGPVSDHSGRNPLISGDWVVWGQGGEILGEPRDLIVARSMTSGIERTVSLPRTAMPLDCSVSGDWLVWSRNRGFDEQWHDLNEIWGMRLSTGERSLLRPKGRYMSPAVEGEWVLWRRTDSVRGDAWADNVRVEAFNLRTYKVRLLPKGATTVSDDGRVLIKTGGRAAFWAGRTGLRVYDVMSQRSTPVPGAVGSITWAAIHDDWVVWYEQQGSGAGGPLHAVNLVSGETVAVAADASFPGISRD